MQYRNGKGGPQGFNAGAPQCSVSPRVWGESGATLPCLFLSSCFYFPLHIGVLRALAQVLEFRISIGDTAVGVSVVLLSTTVL